MTKGPYVGIPKATPTSAIPPPAAVKSPPSLQGELERYADQGEDGPAGQQRPPVHALGLGRGSGGCGEDRGEAHQSDAGEPARHAEQLDQGERRADTADRKQGLELRLPHREAAGPRLDVEGDRSGLALVLDLELERPVLRDLPIDEEENDRPFGRAGRPGASGLRYLFVAGERGPEGTAKSVSLGIASYAAPVVSTTSICPSPGSRTSSSVVFSIVMNTAR